MKSTGLAALMLAGLIAYPAQAGYRELMRDLEAYRPPAYTQPAGEEPGPVAPAAGHRTSAPLADVRSRWAAALATDTAAPAFFRPSADLRRRMAPAVKNPAAAAGLLGGRFSLETLQGVTWVRNPGIQAAADRLRAAVETLSQVSYLDAILEQYTAFTDQLMAGVGPMKGKDPVAMKFPFPGITALKGQIAEKEITSAAETLEAARRDALTTARSTFWNLIFIDRAQAITRQMLDLLTRLESVATTRYESGKTSFQDVIKVRIERETLRVDLATLKGKERNLQARMRELTDLPYSTAVGIPAPATPATGVPALQPLYAMAREHLQELRRMRAQVGKMERMIEMAETMIQPPFTLNLSLTQAGAGTTTGPAAMRDAFPTSTTAAVGAGLPKAPWYGSNDAYLKETRLSLAAMKQELVRAEAATDRRVREAWFALDQARREADLYGRTVVNLSRSALDVSTKGYEAGTVSFADVIASHTLWLKAHLTYQRKLADLGSARAELERTVGAPLKQEKR